ncbi:MAG: hypothetical protein ACKVX7_06470 [Planctomycetota bacterium]
MLIRSRRLFSLLIIGFALLAGQRNAGAQTGTMVASIASGLPGATVTVVVSMTSSTNADGFSFGISHAASQLTPLGILPGAALNPAFGGIAADVFLIQLTPPGGAGVTVGCLIDLGPPPFQTLPAGPTHAVVNLQYVIAATATPGSKTLSFTESLGSPPVEVLLVCGGIPVDPVTTNGSIIVQAVTLRRGDCHLDGSLNLTDAVVCLRRLFGISPPGNCADAQDIDDNGLLNIADATFLLQYLFAGGPLIPAPFGSCGVDPTPDSLGCSSPPACL